MTTRDHDDDNFEPRREPDGSFRIRLRLEGELGDLMAAAARSRREPLVEWMRQALRDTALSDLGG